MMLLKSIAMLYVPGGDDFARRELKKNLKIEINLFNLRVQGKKERE
jgi:hypothetical protein